MSPIPLGGTGKVTLLLTIGGAEIGKGLPAMTTVQFEKVRRISS